jgi:hypothetical protein
MISMTECHYPDRCLDCPWVFTDECSECPTLAGFGLCRTPWGEIRKLPREQTNSGMSVRQLPKNEARGWCG